MDNIRRRAHLMVMVSLANRASPPAVPASFAAAAKAASPDADRFIQHGTHEFLHTNLALFAAGFATFALLYCVQPLMPEFSHVFAVGAATSSLSLSLTTGLLAVSMLVAGALSEAWGRKGVMVISLLASAALTILVGFAPDWRSLLVLRALMGISLSGLPAVAMAYVSEEMHPRSVGLAMGLYIGGSGLGGMAGRLITALIADLAGWRVAVVAIGGLGLLAGLVFWRSLPASRHFQARRLALAPLLGTYRMHLTDAALPWLFAEGFMLMGGFVTIYNYIGYRLLAPPFDLSQGAVGLIFIVYLIGIFSSAWMGNLAGRLGRRHVLWTGPVIMLAGIGLTWLPSLPAIVLGIAVLTFGFFGGHSIASSWVGARARHARAQAASLYLFCYYLGSSIVGSVGGTFWSLGRWPAVVALTGVVLAAGLGIAARAAVIPPLPPTPRGG